MGSLITYHNPLDPLSRKVETIEASKLSDLLDRMEYDREAYRVVIARNGMIVEDYDIEIHEGDSVALIIEPIGSGGGGKNILRTVAMIAVAVVANALLPGSGFLAIVGKIAIVTAGSLLINAILPPTTPGTKTDSFGEQSNTYGWEQATNLVGAGASLPKIYGSLVVTPPCISRYIETIDNKQYLNALFAVSDGSVLSISDIAINGNPIENYDGVTYETRLGANAQALISRFDNTRYDQSISNRLENGADWDTFTTQGDQVSVLTLGLSFPAGLYKIDMDGKDAGEQERAQWSVYAQCSSDGVNWINIAYPAVFSRNTTTPQRFTLTKAGLSPAQYQVRVRATYDTNDGGSSHPSQLWVEYLQEELSDDFTYPNTALLAIRALATDQLSGSFPTVTCTVNQGQRNPADVALSMLAECGIDSARLDIAAFDAWRAVCSARGYTCDTYFDATTNLRRAIDIVATLGRARVEQFGSKFSVIMDVSGLTPVQGFSFGMGNILKDSFKTEFLPISDRANVVEITYYDADNNYEKTIVEVSNESYDSDLEEHRVAINLIGCTSRDMAIRHAKYLLNCNRYITMTSSWEADVDAMVCRFGDVVRVSHDVPQWGESGRIVSATTTSAVLDREVVIESGRYYVLQVRFGSDNSLVDCAVTNAPGTTDTLTFSTLGAAPQEHDTYSFGEIGKASKLMRIISIGTSGTELRRSITAIEYVEDVYDDAAEIAPDVTYSSSIRGLAATDYIRYSSDRSIETALHITWQGSSFWYTVTYQAPSDNAPIALRVYDTTASVVVTETGPYQISVSDAMGNTQSITYTVLGKQAPPDPVTALIIAENTDTFSLAWAYPTPPIDFSHFEVQYSTGSEWVSDGMTIAKSYEIPIKGSGINHLRILAVDTSNVKSDPVSVSAAPSIATITGLTSYYLDGNTYLHWDQCDSSRNAVRYEVRKGDSWVNGLTYIVTTDTKTLADSNARYMVRAVYTTAYGVDIYSEADDSITIDEARLSANVIATFEDSSTGWTGARSTDCIVYDNEVTLADAIGIDSITDFDAVFPFDWFGGIAAYGRYETSDTITLAAQQLCHCAIDITAYAVNEGFYLDDINDLDAITNLDGYVENDFDVVPLISISQDGTTWSDYRRFYAGDYYAQAFRFAVDLYSYGMMIRPVVSAYTYSVDMDDRIEKGNATIVGTDGLTIAYTKPFQVTPNTQITIIDAVAGDDAKLSSISAAGFIVRVYNGGATVSRSINWISQGY